MTSVTDGDTMDVRMPDGSTETIRLLGVDTPETSSWNTEPSEWDSIPESSDGREWLEQWGGHASDYAEERLAGEEIYIEGDPEADRRGTYDRLLVYAYQSKSSSKSFNMRLLENGYARMYDSQFTKRSAYQAAESEARNDGIGVWDYATGDFTDDLSISTIHADAAGSDNSNLNDEYIEVTNERSTAVDMTGWTFSDAAGHTYYFPAGFELGAGESVTIYTGSGSDTDSELYWGQSSAVWNNDGDTVTVTSADGETVTTRAY
ncbi:lamin tail domain-containing protein [Haloterrigena sp. SYSU A558-1]|uniref:Lamin tail domain-containing protein n=1 Tax=Haloterrigena gelatinilytica TaxID=2741724 RepID=A0ABX2LAT0_9EURY|nr:lamin tail domain-containing protein [Haloterrigena gelatinilytica]NUC72500.1 lamin tail domain-containing protein [Haloterrigena gelatinilytica]